MHQQRRNKNMPLPFADAPAGLPRGVRLLPRRLNAEAQRALLGDIVAIVRKAPLFTPRMPKTGRPFSVRMTNAGPLGWVSDKEKGYRYEPTHPETGAPWPPMPEVLLKLWKELTGYPAPPEAALINYYAPGAKMGLHVDIDEEALDAPLLSISLGCSARFRLGGLKHRERTRSFDLHAGDVLVLEGPSRLRYHGIDRIYPGTGDLPAEIGPGRINITLRRVTIP
jgi:alkylated DNA repair protein (DNA oxidative demethylase)